MKERNRIFAVLLAIMMVFTYMPGLAYAAAGDEAEPAVAVESQEEAAAEEAVKEEPAEATEPEVQVEEPAAQAEETEPAASDAEEALPEAEKGAEGQGTAIKVHHGTVKGLADSDELLEAFMDKQIEASPAGRRAKAAGNNRRSTLDEDEQAAYDELQEQIAAVVSADGNDHSSEMSISGITDFDAVDRIVNALMLDMPYEFYWYDKTEGYMAWTVSEGDSYGIVLVFTVANAYRSDEPVKVEELPDGDGGVVEVPVYNIVNTEAPVAAANRAKDLVLYICEKYDTDSGKLGAFKDAVCDQADYNEDAISEDYDGGYGDPWQMIYVFDDNPDTNVVCEGYSKAFQYMCDYAQNQGFFDSSAVDCHTVTGKMGGGTGAGLHMWNILHMDDGKNYMADITNCDDGAIGYPGELFLKGYTSGSVEDGYIYLDAVSYQYDDDTTSQYSYEELEMSPSDYVGGGGQEEEHEIAYTTSHVFYEKVGGWGYGSMEEDNFYYSLDRYDGDVLTVDGKDYVYSTIFYRYIAEDGSTIDGYEVYPDGNSQYENPWKLINGSDTEVTYQISYKGNTATVTATLSPCPDIELSYVKGGKTIENTDGWWHNEDENDIWYEYNITTQLGDVITVNGVEYTYKEKSFEYDEDYSYWKEGFFSPDDELLDMSYFSMSPLTYQSSEHWVLGEDEEEKGFPVTVTYIDKTISIDWTIVKNPIQSISYTTDRVFVENKNGNIWYDEDGEYFNYDVEPEYGDILTVNGKDYVYKHHYDEEDNGWVGFYNGDERLEDVTFSSNQYSEHWVIPEGEDETTVTFTVSYLGRTTEVEAKLIKNPVKAISYTPVNEYAELREGIDGWEDSEGTFTYYTPNFQDGDQLTVSYRDKGDITYIYDSDRDYFVNPDDSKDRIYSEGSEGEVYISADQSEPWTVNNYYDTVVHYEGQTAPGRKIHIVPNPVESIAFSRNGESVIELIEGKDSYETSDWDEESDEEFYYNYYRTRFQPGDILTVTYTEGTTCTYEYARLYGYDYDYMFVNIEDDEDIIDEDYIEFYAEPRQSYENEWKVGGTYTAEVSYMNRTADVEVHILPNPVTNVEFEFADGSETARLVEGVDGEMDWDWIYDETTHDEIRVDYFRYYRPEFKAGDKLIVTRNGGMYEYVYRTHVFDGKYYRGAFVNIYDDDDVIFDDYADDSDEYVEYWDSNQEGASPWEIGGDGYYFEYAYYGVKFRIPVEVVENPVAAIDFERAGYGADDPIELVEGLDADINSDGGANRWFEYYLTFKNGDKFKITDKDGAVSVYNTETYGEYGDDVRYFKNDEGQIIDPYRIDQTSDQSADNQWKPDDGNHAITLGYYAHTKDVNVKIVKNPVQKIDFARPGSEAAELIENGDGYRDGRSFCYEIRFKAGDELYVTYAGESEPVKYVASASPNGKVYEFNAEGSVPSGAEETIDAYDISFRHNRDWQLQDQIDNEVQPTVMLMYKGIWADIPVSIVENKVESFEYTWAEGGDRVELIEGIDGSKTTYFNDDGDFTVFEYWLPFRGGDTLSVRYAGVDTPVAYVYSEETGAFKANGTVPDGVPAMIAVDDLDRESDQDEYNVWEAGGEYEFELGYMGSTFTVPVTVVKDTNSHDINDCEVSFDEEYLENEEIDSTPYPDYFYVVPAGTVLEPIVTDNGRTLESDFYAARYTEVAFNNEANEWQIKDNDNWSDEFPTEVGVYFCEVSGIDPYTGTYEGLLPLIRIYDPGDDPGDEITTTLHPEADGSVRKIVADDISGDINFPENGDSITVGGKTYTYDSSTNAFMYGSERVDWMHWGTDSDYDEDTDIYTFYNLYMYELDGRELGISKIETEYINEILGIEFIPNGRTELNASELQTEDGLDIEKRGDGSFFIEGDKIILTNKYKDATTEYVFTYDPESHEFQCDGYGWAPTYAYCENPAVGDNEVTIDMLGGSTTYVIKIVGEHTHEPVKVDSKAATCTKPGNTEYWYCSCGKYFSDAAGTTEIAEGSWIIDVDPDAHDWDEPTYAWESDNSKVTATRMCKNNVEHLEIESVNTEHTVITPASETENGEEQWTATFKNEAFKPQTKKAVIPAYGHTHSMTHTAAVPASCTENGNSEYWYCSGCGKYFSDAEGTNEIVEGSWVIPAKTHSWGAWQNDSVDQHKRVCANDSAHVEYADHVWDEGAVTIPATETTEGEMTYTCTVCGGTKTEPIAPTGGGDEDDSWFIYYPENFGFENDGKTAIFYMYPSGEDEDEAKVYAYYGTTGDYEATGFDYLWVKGTGEPPETGWKHKPINTGNEFTENVLEQGYYTLYVKDGEGNVKSLRAVVKDNPWTAKGTPTQTCYTGEPIKLTVTVTPSVSGISYEWYKYDEEGDTKLPGTASSITVNEVAGYHCRISYGSYSQEVWFNITSVDGAISLANDLTAIADDRASYAENLPNDATIEGAEEATANAAEQVEIAEAAAVKAFDNALDNYEKLVKEGASSEQIEIAETNLKNAAANVAVAKQLKAAVSSAVARSKKAAANVAASKAAAAYSAAQAAGSSAAADAYRKEAEAQAAIAAEKAGEADAASADAEKAVKELEAFADTINDTPVADDVKEAIEESIETEKAKADTSASDAGNAATAADQSSNNAKASANNAKAAVNSKAQAEAAARAEAARQGVADSKIPKVKGVKKPAAKKTSITVKWTKFTKAQLKKSKATKYEIWVCPNTAFGAADTKIKTVGKGKSSAKISGLKKNTKYYVKVRAIRTVGSVKYVGKWSSRKTIKTPKK